MQKKSYQLNNLKTLTHISSIRQLLMVGILILGISFKAASQEYFQQEVNYNIKVSLNDQRHELNAFETVEYINNSTDTLHFLYFHLWPNGYSNNNTELAKQLFFLNGRQKLFNDPELRGYIDSLDFKVDNQQAHWNLLPNQCDICLLTFNKPLKPGGAVKIATPFHVKIPKGVTSRLGHIEDSYQISQWYPKPAVYDRNGWHQMSYQDQGEFYSEFGHFDVSITLPDNYIVGATGNLQNEQETAMLDQLAADTTWKSNLGSEKAEFPPSSKKLKTLRYTENKIHDFAWFADKRFHVLKGKVKLPDSGREVTTRVMFTNQQAKFWKDAIPYLNNSIASFSKWNGDYPYNNFTAVQSALNAGQGMEYPGIAVIGTVQDAFFLDEVIAHEIGHSWFYGALGSDERRYPFMDEGITTANELRYLDERFPHKKLWEVFFKNIKLAKFFHIDKMPVKQMGELGWLSQARENLEQPIDLQASAFTQLNYSLIIYYKTGMGFNYLRAYLGDSLYDAAMHEYYRQWKFKHPQPDDLRKLFESFTGKDLSWFFSDFIGTTKRMDYKVVRLENQKLLVKNNGELVSPFVVCGMIGDSVCFSKWVEGFEGQKWIDLHVDLTGFQNLSGLEIKIDPGHVTPELYRLNNNIRQRGIFPKADPIRTQLYFTLEDPEKRYLMFLPAFNWTRENGFMFGMALHNGFLTPKRFEYFMMPFYTFGNPGAAGYGKLAYNITPYDILIRKAVISLEGTQFGAPGNQNYHNLKAGLDIYFRDKNMNNSLTQKVFGKYIVASDLFLIEHLKKAGKRSYLQFGYRLEKSGFINPFNLSASFESGPAYQKTSAEFNYKLSYLGKKNGLEIRLFTGTMLKSNPNVPFYAFSASGRSGREQYLYQGTYPDRFSAFPTTFWSRQMTLSEGGLVSPLNDALRYSRWLVSLSLTSALPGIASRLPVKPFVNVLLNDHGGGTGHDAPLFYEAGFKAGIWNFFEIYFPLLVSGNIQSINGSISDRIRFVFSLDSFTQVRMSSFLGIKIL